MGTPGVAIGGGVSRFCLEKAARLGNSSVGMTEPMMPQNGVFGKDRFYLILYASDSIFPYMILLVGVVALMLGIYLKLYIIHLLLTWIGNGFKIINLLLIWIGNGLNALLDAGAEITKGKNV